MPALEGLACPPYLSVDLIPCRTFLVYICKIEVIESIRFNGILSLTLQKLFLTCYANELS